MADTRLKNTNWNVANPVTGTLNVGLDWQPCVVAVLMDIRDELQTLNQLLNCPNFMGIPRTLKVIQKNTTKPRRKKVPHA